MAKLFKALLFSAFLLDLAFGNEYFSIVGPRFLRVGDDLEVFLSSTNFSVPTNLELSLWAQKPRKKIENFVFKLPVKSQKVIFNLRVQQVRQNYTLYAGIPSKNIAKNTNIYVSEVDYTVLIQTEKNVYKAGERVNFRILAVDADLKPYRMKKMLVLIIDANENVIVRNASPLISNGATEDNLVLSDDAVIGEWEIHVKIDNDERMTKKKIEVKSYHETRFEAVIDTSPIVYTNGNATLTVTIYAKYNFSKKEKFISGTATFTVNVFRRETDTEPIHVYSNISTVEEKVKLTLDLKNDLMIEETGAFLQLLLTFEEKLSNEKISTEESVTVHGPNTKKFEIQRDYYFKPGLPYTVDVVVKDENGSLLQNSRSLPSLTVIYYNDHGCNATSESKNNQREYVFEGAIDHHSSRLINGTSRFTIETQIQNSALNLKLECDGSVENVNVFRAISRTRKYIQAKIISGRVQTNELIKVEVAGSEDFETLNVVILDDHRILFSDTHKKIKKNPFVFDLPVHLDRVFGSVMFVYYYEPLGEIIYDRIDLNFDDEIYRKVQMTLNERKVHPGQEIILTASSTSNSTIYLSAIDKKQHDLKGNHFNELSMELRRRFKQPSLPPSKQAHYLEFTDSNVFILTNADKGKYDCKADGTRITFDSPNIVLLEENEAPDSQATGVRSNFSSSWLFQSFTVHESKRLELSRKVPDSITNWLISGFSIDNEIGLRALEPMKLEVFKPFFIDVDLPDTVRLHEVIKVEIFICNHGDTGKATVTLFNDEGSFEYVDECNLKNPSSSKDFHIEEELKTTKTVVFFCMRATTAGKLTLRFKATMGNATDEAHYMLDVKHTGVAASVSSKFLIDLRSEKHFSKAVQLNLTQIKAVGGSVEIVASLKGNILGSLVDSDLNQINGLQQFVSTIYQLEYLNVTSQLTLEKRSEKLQALKKHYQNLIRTRDSTGGSFAGGCVWMTAFAANCMGRAKPWIEIEENILIQALDFLKKQQSDNGGYKKQNANQDDLSLTAYVVVAFMETPNYSENLRSQTNNAVKFIKNKLEENQTNHNIAIATYALALTKDTSFESFANVLESKSETVGDERFWRSDIMEAARCNSCLPEDVAVETASYALLGYIAAKEYLKALPVLKWLIANRNFNRNAFAKETSTRLQAVIEAAKVFQNEFYSVRASINNNAGNRIHKVEVSSNITVEQTVKVSTVSDEVVVSATGHGIAVFEITLKYISNVEVNSNKFNLTVSPKKEIDFTTLDVCALFNCHENPTNWPSAVMELSLPSGFELYPTSLTKSLNIKTSESRADVSVYIEKLNSTGTCYEFKLIRKNVVMSKTPSFVKVSGFFQPDNCGVKIYKLESDGKVN